MRSAVTLYIAVTCLALAFLGDASAQPGKGKNPQPGPKGNSPLVPQMPVVVVFKNETKNALVVQGYTSVQGVQRRGQPVVMQPNRPGFDLNVPPGIRLYSIYDANQPSNILLRDFPVPVKGDLLFMIRSQGAGKVQIVPAQP